MIKLTDFSMKNVAAIFIIMLLLLVGGSYSTTTLKVESMPDITFPVVIVSTTYKAPPKDVLDEITKPIEKAVAGLSGLKNLTSSSQDNYSQIILELEQNKKPEDVKKDVESLVANVKLPQGAEKPKVLTAGFASQPVYYMAVYGENGMNQTELDKIYKDTILPGFNGLKGIDHVDSVGNQEAVLSIKLDAAAINNYGLTPADVSGMIKASLVSSPAGSVDFNGNSQMVRVKGEFDTIYNLDNLKMTTKKGDTLLLKQVAKVEAISESTFIARLDDKPAIGVLLYKTKVANAVEFADNADKLMKGWEESLPGVKFHVVLNGATSIKESVHGMVQEGGLGAVLASLMILLFLRNIRMTFIVLVSIPLSILVTLLLMAPLGISLNIMTLGGLAIAVGRVVDDSIVVIENIYSQLQKAQERNESVIRLATQQVSSAITSSTITTVAVFAPIALVSGVVGEVFRPFALTLVCALMSSLLVALTVIPMLAKLMVLKSKKIHQHDENHVGKVGLRYKKALIWSLNNRVKTLLSAALLFVLSFVLIVPHLAMSFMPASDSDKQVLIQVKMPLETSLDMMNEKSKEIEAMLKTFKDQTGQPVFKYNESLVGYNFSSDKQSYRTSMFTEVSAATNAKEALKIYKEEIMKLLPQGSDVNLQLISFGGDGGGSSDFLYSLKGDDLLYLKKAAETIKEKMKEFPELIDIKDSLSDSKTEVEITVDQNKARLYSLTTAQILQTVNNWIAEEKLGDLKFDNITYETKVLLNPIYKNSVDKMGNFLIQTPAGQNIQLNEVAKIRQIDAPIGISREGQEQVLNVTAKIDNADKGGVSAKVSAELAKIELPSGVSREVKGVSDDINKSFMEMFMAMGASIFIVYLVMVLAFGNARAPFAILFSLPLAAIGGLLGLLLTGESLNVTSLIGFLMLIGIVVTNAIVLIDRVQQLREQNYAVRDALIEAGMTRLRPIIMTAGATIIALLPLGLGLSKGTIISKGLAVVVIGGLTTSTLLTLLIVPIIYEVIFSRRERKWFKRKGKSDSIQSDQTAPAAHEA
ncbi:efflux RND transporter permease subunit [Paenibacillus sp. SYP-B3998]|uniref:Efflux RND transporter permease subunit n=1 Tax=Paenibacillus sp. SYP-B3998 TaxID=2678564 RepID=A0A6G3ZV74_9BACL|nr:efflux RND transporter permease subunit [Paenibacillus sp. SYP-B3998]NEW05317.1 efflux RND transporter permease subunit [Paenibacillus sp. SYP-B3998]